MKHIQVASEASWDTLRGRSCWEGKGTRANEADNDVATVIATAIATAIDTVIATAIATRMAMKPEIAIMCWGRAH